MLVGTSKKLRIKVRSNSIVSVRGNIYLVHGRLIGEDVEVRLFAEWLEVWYAQRKVETLPRLRGKGAITSVTGTSSTG